MNYELEFESCDPACNCEECFVRRESVREITVDQPTGAMVFNWTYLIMGFGIKIRLLPAWARDR
jgi:hypothetical protein